MAEKAKKVAAAKWTRNDAVFTVAWAHGPVDTVDTSKFNDDVRRDAFYNGTKQTLSDSYALGAYEVEVDGKKVTRFPTPEEKREAFLERLESLNNGVYREGRTEGEPRAYVMIAMQRLYPAVFAPEGSDEAKQREIFDAFVAKSMAKKECNEAKLLRSLREDKRVAPVIAAIKAERGIKPMEVDDILADVENLPETE